MRLFDCLDHVKAAQQRSQISCAWHRLADALEDNGGNEAAQDDYYDDAMDSQLLNSSRGKEVCLAHSASPHHLAPSLPVAVHKCHKRGSADSRSGCCDGPCCNGMAAALSCSCLSRCGMSMPTIV